MHIHKRLISKVLWLLALLPLGIAAIPKRVDRVTLYITGDLRGNLAPCGCSSPMIGGIKRFGSLLAGTPAKQRLLLVNGGLLPLESKTPIEYRQGQIKLETLAQTFGELGAAAINLGAEEAARGQATVETLDRLSGHRLISSLLSVDGTKPFADQGSFRILGLTANPSLLGSLLPNAPRADWPSDDHKRTIVLLRGDEQAARAISNAHPELELIVYSAQGTPPIPVQVGKTWLASPGDGGRYLLRIEDDGTDLLTPRVISLTPDIPDNPLVARLYSGYLKRVDQSGLLEAWPRAKTAAFAGSESCLKCHADESTVWALSAHAHAMNDLVKVGHQRDPDCVECHVTGLSSTLGFKSLALTPQLANVTCESCHGPSAAHVAAPRVNRLPVLTLRSCVRCHSADNSPRFDPQTYWMKIKHGKLSPEN